MKKILLVNPPIYDFTAYDFWLKPFGILKIGGYLRRSAQVRLFDFMDRKHPALANYLLKEDSWGRGKFLASPAEKPEALSAMPSKYRRFGLSADIFESELENNGPYDFALIQTEMTYWYPGIQEVIECLRRISPSTRIVMGGVYATICPDHARQMGADLCVSGLDLASLWSFLDLEPDLDEPPFWEGYPILSCGVIKLTEGCPFRCTYCSVPQIYKGFEVNDLRYSMNSVELAVKQGAQNLAFYDDSLLFRWEDALGPFLDEIIAGNLQIRFHTPNALNARMISQENARLMERAGFTNYYLGFESSAVEWQGKTGDKVYSEDLARAVEILKSAGADPGKITAYIIIGHPDSSIQDPEGSIRFAGSLGIKVMLSEFSPIPGTPDGDKCSEWIDLSEPLHHNKTYFTNIFLGREETQELKTLCREQNRKIENRGSR